MFTLLDVHDEIYLVARIEKILDGTSLASSIQPYMNTVFSNNNNSNNTNNPNSESSRVKTALRLYKKMQTLVKSKIVSYRQPFAWAARPVFKRSTTTTTNLELDSDAKFSIYKQEDQHLSDDDLLKYLADFRLKEKYKLVTLGGDLNLVLKDFSPSPSTDSSSRFY